MPLTVKELALAKGFKAEELEKFGVRNGALGVEIPYFLAGGAEYTRCQIRTAIEKGWRWSGEEGATIPYGLNRPVPYSDKGYVWIVEGASDCWALWLSGIAALGIPGARNTGTLRPEHLLGAKGIIVNQEPGEAGKEFPSRIASRLFGLGYTGEIFRTTIEAFKDPRDAFQADRGAFRDVLTQAWRKRIALEKPRVVTGEGTKSVTLEELFDEPEVEVDWQIDTLLPKGGILLLSAKPKAGKTVLARNAALAIARGERFLGRACQAGTVLYIALEGPKEHHLSAIKAMGMRRDDPIRFYFGRAPEDAIAWLERECQQYHISTVVIDTWHKLTLIENINDYAAVNRANEPLMRLAERYKLCQIWVHHNNKGVSINGDEVLGSSALFAAADTLMIINRGNEGLRTVRTIQRFGEDMEDTVIEMDEKTERLTSAGSKYLYQIEQMREKVLTALGPGGLYRHDLLDAVEGRRSVILASIKELVRTGELVKRGTGKPTDRFWYELSQSATFREPPPKNSGTLIPAIDKEPWVPSNFGQTMVPAPTELSGGTGTTGHQGIAGTNVSGVEYQHGDNVGFHQDGSGRTESASRGERTQRSLGAGPRSQSQGVFVGPNPRDPSASGDSLPFEGEASDGRLRGVQTPEPALHQTAIGDEEGLLAYAVEKLGGV